VHVPEFPRAEGIMLKQKRSTYSERKKNNKVPHNQHRQS